MMKVIFDEHWVPSKMWYTRSRLPESAVLFRMWLSWMIPCQPWTLMWVPKSFKDALWRSETGRLTLTDLVFQKKYFSTRLQSYGMLWGPPASITCGQKDYWWCVTQFVVLKHSE